VANIGVIDSKYRFVILAARRARQLYCGASPRIVSSGKKPIRVAQEEVAAGLVEYELVEPMKKDKSGSRGKTKTLRLEKRTVRMAS